MILAKACRLKFKMSRLLSEKVKFETQISEF